MHAPTCGETQTDFLNVRVADNSRDAMAGRASSAASFLTTTTSAAFSDVIIVIIIQSALPRSFFSLLLLRWLTAQVGLYRYGERTDGDK